MILDINLFSTYNIEQNTPPPNWWVDILKMVFAPLISIAIAYGLYLLTQIKEKNVAKAKIVALCQRLIRQIKQLELTRLNLRLYRQLHKEITIKKMSLGDLTEEEKEYRDYIKEETMYFKEQTNEMGFYFDIIRSDLHQYFIEYYHFIGKKERKCLEYKISQFDKIKFPLLLSFDKELFKGKTLIHGDNNEEIMKPLRDQALKFLREESFIKHLRDIIKLINAKKGYKLYCHNCRENHGHDKN